MFTYQTANWMIIKIFECFHFSLLIPKIKINERLKYSKRNLTLPHKSNSSLTEELEEASK